MNCRQVEKSLPLYVSGDIGGRRGRRIGLHLEACLRCRAAFDRYADERCRLRAVRNQDREQELTGFYDELAARLGPVRRVQAARAVGRGRVRRIGFGLAASVVLCAVLTWAWYGHFGPQEPVIDPASGAGVRVLAGPGEPDRVEPFRMIATQTEARGRAFVIPASYEPRMVILAGPRAAVPIEAPALPAEPPIPRVQPYACPSTLSGSPVHHAQ